ncbi:MAG TPA: homocysteine S-methyltransferase family protein [Conexibacter sp.]|nr:homocysteine S-methyltransferase family protein [Conexibacter sp.]
MRAAADLPQLAGETLFLADGGLETALIFHQGVELPCFAAFVLLDDETGRAALRTYFEPYLRLAAERGVGLVLDTATWRANPDWGRELGYAPEALDAVNRAAVAFARELRDELPEGVPAVVNGVVGPRGDGYVADRLMTAEDAAAYHGRQLELFAQAGADMATAVTMTYAAEAEGIVAAAQRAGLPVAISFTVETDGRLPSGQPLREAIEQVDAANERAAAYFMVNCAHPTHFEAVLEEDGAWRERIVGIRANASRMSHAELDEAEQLDDGDPVELASEYRALRERLPRLSVVGGCCGTDHRHVGAIRDALLG